jgi:hypothetical protein
MFYKGHCLSLCLPVSQCSCPMWSTMDYHQFFSVHWLWHDITLDSVLSSCLFPWTHLRGNQGCNDLWCKLCWPGWNNISVPAPGRSSYMFPSWVGLMWDPCSSCPSCSEVLATDPRCPKILFYFNEWYTNNIRSWVVSLLGRGVVNSNT